MTKEEALTVSLNVLIRETAVDTNNISDGYHTFGELYEHRISLFILACKYIQIEWKNQLVWRSLKHSDGELAYGGNWFVLGIYKEKGWQITYHLPISRWNETSFAEELEIAPEWDGHTSQDVLERLAVLISGTY